MTVDALEVEFDLQPPDLLAWWRFQWGRQRTVKVFPWLAGFGLALFAMNSASPESSVEATLIMGLLVMAVGFFISRELLRGSLRRSAAGLQKTKAGPTMFGPHRLRVDLVGVSEQGPAGSHSYRWEAVDELCETPHHFFLIVAGGYAYVVPKRAFPTEVAAAEFWSGARALKVNH